MEDFDECQQELLELRNQLAMMTRKQERTEEELAAVRRELDDVVAATSDEIDELRQEVKLVRDEKSLADVNWSGVVSDKEEDHKVQMRRAQEREYDLVQKTKALEEEV